MRRALSLLSRVKSLRVGSYIGPVLGAISVLAIAWFALVFHSAVTLAGSAARIVGLAIALIFIGMRRERFAKIFIRHFGWLPVSLGAISIPYWLWYASSYAPPSEDFFTTAALILPVILLAAVVDVRRSESLKSYQLAMPILAVFLGELAALNEIAFSSSLTAKGFTPQTSGDFASVAASFVAVIAALILAVLADFPESSTSTEPAGVQHDWSKDAVPETIRVPTDSVEEAAAHNEDVL